MTPPDRLRSRLSAPEFVVMPAVWDGLTAKLTAKAGFETAFLSGSCVAASRLGGPDLDLLSFAEMFDAFSQARAAAPDLLNREHHQWAVLIRFLVVQRERHRTGLESVYEV